MKSSTCTSGDITAIYSQLYKSNGFQRSLKTNLTTCNCTRINYSNAKQTLL